MTRGVLLVNRKESMSAIPERGGDRCLNIKSRSDLRVPSETVIRNSTRRLVVQLCQAYWLYKTRSKTVIVVSAYNHVLAVSYLV